MLSFSVLPARAYYLPGETLDPNCQPSDSDCTVSQIVGVNKGGTGITSFNNGDLLYATGSTTLSKLGLGSNGQILRVENGSLTWGNDAGGTSYTAGSGLSLNVSSFSLDYGSNNTWTGIQTFDNGFKLGSNTYTSLVGTGLQYSSGTLSTTLGTDIASSEITNGTILAEDISEGTITFAKIAQNSCGNNQIMKWNGFAWACSADQNNEYTSGTGLSLSSNIISLDINGLSTVSSIDPTDTVAVYTSTGTKKITRSDLFSDVLGAMNYRGTWDATSNSPSLTSYCGTSTKGHYYVVGTSGTTSLNGINSWAVNDWAVCNGTSWEKVQTTNSILSVFGRTGSVIASSGDYNASQITNTANGNIAAVTVQNALNELDSEKIAKTLNSGLVFVGNASNVATAVALSGDATVNDTGVITIGLNSVALGNDTTGNYIATLTDSGENIFTVSNSGSENAGVTLALANDVLDFTKLSDSLTLDASTSITLGSNNFTFTLTGGGLPKITRTSSGEWINMSDGTDSFSLYNTTTTPEGSLAANIGSLAVNTSTGQMYIKTTDTLNTGWAALIDAVNTQTISGAKTFSSAITAPISANTINGLIINSGALSGVASIAGSGALAINSNGTNAITIDSGTTGAVNIGTGNNAKTISIGTGTAGNTVNIATDNTTADTIAIGSALDTVTIKGNIILDGNVTVNGNILPGTTDMYSLGSSAKQWMDIYASTNSIYIGGTALSNSSGSLQWNGSSVGGGGGATTLQNISSNTTLAGWTRTAKADATSASVTVTLPTAVGNSGQMIEVTKTDNSANTVRVAANGSESINGSTNLIYLYSQNDSVVIRSDGTNSYIVADNRSSVGQSKSYMQANATANQTSNVVTDGVVVFDTTSSYGSDISFNNSTDTFTLKAGKTYRLSGNVGYSDFSSVGYMKWQWRDVTNSAYIGYQGQVDSVNGSADNAPANDNAIAIVTPTVDTSYRLQLLAGSAYNILGGPPYPSAYIEVLSTPQNVVNTVDYVKVNRTTDLGVTPGENILFNQTETGNIPYNSANGQFTLKAGKTYLLNATAALTAGDNAFDFQWRTTSGTFLGSAATANGYANSNSPAVAVFTPSTDTIVTVNIIAEGNSAVMRGGYVQATIQQIGSTASTGVALNNLIEATTNGSLDNQNYGQAWSWSTATTETGLSMTGNALTTGGLLNLTSSSANLNSTNGLLYVANTGASTAGLVARIQSNSTAESGLTVSANGLVGIGTSTPTAGLQVHGTDMQIMIDRATASTGYGQLLFADAGIENWSIGQRIGDQKFHIYKTLGTAGEALTIDTSGNIGIGTTSPETTLDVNGTGRFVSPDIGTTGGVVIRDNSSNDGNYLQFVNNANAVQYAYIQGLSSGGLALMGGNIGIGTTSPSTTLQVNGTARFGGGTYDLGLGSWTGNTAGHIYYTGSADKLVLGDGSTAMMTIKDSKVGIGLVSPSVALDVSGDIEYTGTITDVSDATLKENMVSLTGSLEKMLKLNAISFNMIGDNTKELGFTAQNVKEYFPELVSVIDPESGILGLNYVGLIAPIVQSIQDQQKFIVNLEDIVNNLGIRIDDISTELQTVMKRLDSNEEKIEELENRIKALEEQSRIKMQ